jgi:hypothetical protein
MNVGNLARGQTLACCDRRAIQERGSARADAHKPVLNWICFLNFEFENVFDGAIQQNGQPRADPKRF